MMMSSNLTSNQCCFDFGSGETNDSDDGNATMNAIYYGTDCWTGNCTGPGPWVGGDLENGMYFSNTGNNPSAIPSETARSSPPGRRTTARPTSPSNTATPSQAG
jgi:hypothetical protein